MVESFTLSGSDPSSSYVTLSELEQPDADPLTWLRVQIDGDGLRAACATESFNGDDGLDLNSEEQVGDGTRIESIRLGQLMVDLGSGPLWEEPRRWRTIGGELGVVFNVDRLGHVDVDFRLTPIPWQPTWSASTLLRYTMGDLISTGRRLTSWIDSQVLRGGE
ncbi:MAG: hypothetical protein KF703_07010 [Actinobacteria bacterium]|nr:hypothetical protein [Actinomycetota bacterium]